MPAGRARALGAVALLALLGGVARSQGSDAAAIAQLIRAGEYPQAVARAQAAERAAPRDVRPITLEAMALSLEGKRDAAAAAFARALRLAPDDPAALRGAVELLYAKGDARAEPLLERILARDPADRTAHEMLASLRARGGECAAANEHFRLAGDALQTHPASLELYGACLAQMREPKLAEPVFAQLLALRPDSVDARYDLALVTLEAGDAAGALQTLEPLRSREPADADVAELAARAEEAAGDTPKAVSTLREALVAHPDQEALYSSFAKLCLDHDSYQVGIDMLSAGLKHLPASPVLHVLRGLMYAQLARYDAAELDFSEADRLDSRQPLGAYATDLAELEKAEQQKEAPEVAIRRVRAQLREHPESAQLHALLAKLLLGEQSGAAEAGQEREATEELLKAVRLAPDFVPARNLLASAYLQQGKYPEAEAQCRAVLAQSPDDPTALYHLATALRHSSDPAEREQIKALLARLREVQKQSLEQETQQKRFRLVEPGK